ncbi:hypothetical protein Kpho01_50620 [Kitasatospora phosalacinea]|uniref:Uncharacterized protein n=1 Tax=Kitasatospora phosalacinea TaxID=2065 RepID=A0A9W6PL49_9ACTN|nr:hypothetical protein Kpho01_50620 [Kitasatospora phosalacinea]
MVDHPPVDHGTDDGVQAGAVTAAGQDTNTHCFANSRAGSDGRTGGWESDARPETDLLHSIRFLRPAEPKPTRGRLPRRTTRNCDPTAEEGVAPGLSYSPMKLSRGGTADHMAVSRPPP